jgi:hypothetical protein
MFRGGSRRLEEKEETRRRTGAYCCPRGQSREFFWRDFHVADHTGAQS